MSTKPAAQRRSPLTPAGSFLATERDIGASDKSCIENVGARFFESSVKAIENGHINHRPDPSAQFLGHPVRLNLSKSTRSR
jgi:hypothetical protein